MPGLVNLLLTCTSMIFPMSESITPMKTPTSRLLTQSSVPEGFYYFGGYPGTARDLTCEDGYITYSFEVFKMDYTSQSNLFIVHTRSSFVPGHVAVQNNEPGFKDYYLKSGYVHLTLERANSNGNHGGTIYPKLMWPNSTTVTTVSTSSTSTQLAFNYGNNQGVTFENGSLQFTAGSSNSTTLSVQNTTSLTSQFIDPILSAQYSPNNLSEAQWNFDVINWNPTGKVTFTFDQFFLFEMMKDSTGMNENAFDVIYSVKYKGQYQGIFGILFEGWDFTRSTRITCFY